MDFPLCPMCRKDIYSFTELKIIPAKTNGAQPTQQRTRWNAEDRKEAQRQDKIAEEAEDEARRLALYDSPDDSWTPNNLMEQLRADYNLDYDDDSLADQLAQINGRYQERHAEENDILAAEREFNERMEREENEVFEFAVAESLRSLEEERKKAAANQKEPYHIHIKYTQGWFKTQKWRPHGQEKYSKGPILVPTDRCLEFTIEAENNYYLKVPSLNDGKKITNADGTTGQRLTAGDHNLELYRIGGKDKDKALKHTFTLHANEEYNHL